MLGGLHLRTPMFPVLPLHVIDTKCFLHFMGSCSGVVHCPLRSCLTSLQICKIMSCPSESLLVITETIKGPPGKNKHCPEASRNYWQPLKKPGVRWAVWVGTSWDDSPLFDHS